MDQCGGYRFRAEIARRMTATEETYTAIQSMTNLLCIVHYKGISTDDMTHLHSMILMIAACRVSL